MFTTLRRWLASKHNTGRHSPLVKPLGSSNCKSWIAFCAGMFAAAAAISAAHAQALAPGQVVGWDFNNVGQISIPAGLSNVSGIASGLIRRSHPNVFCHEGFATCEPGRPHYTALENKKDDSWGIAA